MALVYVALGVVIGWHFPQPAWVKPLFVWVKTQVVKQFTK